MAQTFDIVVKETGIDSARQKLESLGTTARQADSILDGLNASFQGLSRSLNLTRSISEMRQFSSVISGVSDSIKRMGSGNPFSGLGAGGTQAARSLEGIGNAAVNAMSKVEALNSALRQTVSLDFSTMITQVANLSTILATAARNSKDIRVPPIPPTPNGGGGGSNGGGTPFGPAAGLGTEYSRIIQETTGRTDQLISRQTALNSAFRDGAIPENYYRQQLGLTNAELLRHTNSLNGTTASSRVAGYQMQNLSYQLNDVITGFASGQPPMQIFAQQGGQIFQIFQQMTVSAGSVSSALKALGSSLLAIVMNPYVLGFAVVVGGIFAAFKLLESSVQTTTGETASYGNVLSGITKYLSDVGKETTNVTGATNQATGATSALGSTGNSVYGTLSEYIAAAARQTRILAIETGNVITKLGEAIRLNKALAQGPEAGYAERRQQFIDKSIAEDKKNGITMPEKFINKEMNVKVGESNFLGMKKDIYQKFQYHQDNPQYTETEKQYGNAFDRKEKSDLEFKMSKETLEVKNKALKISSDQFVNDKNRIAAAKDLAQIQINNFGIEGKQVDEQTKQKIFENELEKLNLDNTKERLKANEGITKKIAESGLQSRLKLAVDHKDYAAQLDIRKAILTAQNDKASPENITQLAQNEVDTQRTQDGIKASHGADRKGQSDGNKAARKVEQEANRRQKTEDYFKIETDSIRNNIKALQDYGVQRQVQNKLDDANEKAMKEQANQHKALTGLTKAQNEELKKLYTNMFNVQEIQKVADGLYAESKGAVQGLIIEEQGINKAYKDTVITLTEYNRKLAENKIKKAELNISQGKGTEQDQRTITGGLISSVTGPDAYQNAMVSAQKSILDATLGANVALKAQEEALQRVRGNLTPQQYQQQKSGLKMQGVQNRINDGTGSANDVGIGALNQAFGQFKGVLPTITNDLGNFFSQMGQGLGDSISKLLTMQGGFEDLGNVARQALGQLVGGLVQLGVQWLINEAISATVGATATASTAVEAGAAATAWAPAAAMASLATLGANAAPATAAITGTNILAQTLASVPGLKEGGFTGMGGVNDIAGVVHGQEFVVNAKATSLNRPALEAMNRGGGTGSSYGSSSNSNNHPRVVVNNYGTPQAYQVDSVSRDEIRLIAKDVSEQTVAKRTPSIVSNQIKNPNSQVSKALGNNTKVQRRRNG